MKPKFCRGCGKHLKDNSKTLPAFDPFTGKVAEVPMLVCPDRTEPKDDLHDRWEEHGGEWEPWNG